MSMVIPPKQVVLVFRDGEFLGSPDKGVWWDEEGARIFAAGVEYGAGTIAGGFTNGGVSAYVYPADEDVMAFDLMGKPEEVEKATAYARERLGPEQIVDRTKLTPYRQKLADDGHCMADGDGDCAWEGCPQLRDAEPKKSGRSCPRWIETMRRLDPDDEGRAGG